MPSWTSAYGWVVTHTLMSVCLCHLCNNTCFICTVIHVICTISIKMECDYHNGWILKKQKTVTYAKISPKMVNPRDIAWEHRRRRRSLQWHPCAICIVHVCVYYTQVGTLLAKLGQYIWACCNLRTSSINKDLVLLEMDITGQGISKNKLNQVCMPEHVVICIQYVHVYT